MESNKVAYLSGTILALV